MQPTAQASLAVQAGDGAAMDSDSGSTLLQIDMEVERAPYKTTIFYICSPL